MGLLQIMYTLFKFVLNKVIELQVVLISVETVTKKKYFLSLWMLTVILVDNSDCIQTFSSFLVQMM
jgi:hypothetical protein